MMYKAFSLVGVFAALFLFQGCGGKKKEVASAPAAVTSQPDAPPAESKEQSNDQGSSSLMSLPGGNSGGDSSGTNSSGSESEGESQNSGGSGLLGGMPPKSGSTELSGLIQKGGARNNVNTQENSNLTAQNNPPRNNFARPTLKAAPPPTLKEQSVYAFQTGNPKRAYTLLQSHALTLSEEEAAEILQHYRWSAHKKRLQLGLNIAVGVTVKNPQNHPDLSPIGTKGLNNGGGGGMGEMGMIGRGSSGGFGSGNTNSSKTKTFAETTGAFGTELVAAFKSKHESGAWSTVFSEYSLGVPSSNSGQIGGSSGFGGNAFGGPQPGFQAGGSSQSGFVEGDSMAEGIPGGASMGSAMGNSGMAGAQGSSTPAGNSGGMMDSSGGLSGPAGNSGGMSGPAGNSGGMSGPAGNSGGMSGPAGNSGGMGAGIPKGNSGGPKAGSMPQFQGKGGMGLAGIGGDGLSGPGEQGLSGAPGGNLDESGMGLAGPGMIGNSAIGNGMPNAGRTNLGPFAIGKLPAGSSPLAPCLTFIGVDETSKLMKKAVQEGYDGLMLFEVTIGYNRARQIVLNDTFIRVVQPSLVAKEVKRVYVSNTINNVQYAKSQAKGEPDGLEETVEKTVKMTKDGLALQPIPAGMTPELIANKRIPSLASDKEASVIDRLSEVNFYYYKGFIDENQKADAYEKIASQLGRSIAMGTDAEKKEAVEKLLEIELKQ